jgi:hypothetical protein
LPDVRFVFMVGTGRCGSTVVARVLASHRAVGFISEIDLRLRRLSGALPSNNAVFRGLGNSLALTAAAPNRGGVRASAARIADRFRTVAGPWEAYELLADEVSPMVAAPFRDLVAPDAAPWVAERFRRFFVNRALESRKPFFLHKFTGWPRARFINAVFPDARFIHVVRDGRAVANSLLQVPWWRGYRGPPEWTFGPLREDYAKEWDASGQSFAVLAALEWKTLMDAFEVTEQEIPSDRWLNVRYEDFVDEPREALDRMLGFAGLSWTQEFERQFATWNIRRHRKDAYLTDLNPNDVQTMTRSLASHLRRWGYTDGLP